MNSNLMYEKQSDAESVRSFRNTETRSEIGSLNSFRNTEASGKFNHFQCFRNPESRSEISSNRSCRSFATHSEIGSLQDFQSASSIVYNNCARWAEQVSIGNCHAQQDPQEAKSYSYAEKRIAGLILKRQNEKSFGNPTVEWLEKLQWAQQVLPNLSQEWSREEHRQSKRHYSQDGTGPSAKRNRLPPRLSFVELAKRKMLLGVMDKGQPDDRILRSHWKWIEAALASRCFELLRQVPGPPPFCKDVGWYQGNIKVIACENARSAELFKVAVARVGEVYPGAKLVALDWCEVPSQPRARIRIPTSLAKPEVILNMLQRCNPHMPTHDWRVVKIETSSGPTCQAILKLNRQSLAPIAEANGELNFGFSSVSVNIYKSDITTNTFIQPNAQNMRSEIEYSNAAIEPSGFSSNVSRLVCGFQELSCEENESLLDDISNNSDDTERVLRIFPSFDNPPSR